jgi:hypothetical protein
MRPHIPNVPQVHISLLCIGTHLQL